MDRTTHSTDKGGSREESSVLPRGREQGGGPQARHAFIPRRLPTHLRLSSGLHHHQQTHNLPNPSYYT